MEWFWELEKLKCLRGLLPQVHHLTDAAVVLETTTVLTRYIMFPQTSILGGDGERGGKKKNTQEKKKKDQQPPKTRNKPCLYKALGSVPGLLTCFMMISWRGFFLFHGVTLYFALLRCGEIFFLGKGYLPASCVFCFSLCHILCTCIVFCTYLQYFIGVFYLLIPPPKKRSLRWCFNLKRSEEDSCWR